MKAYLSPEHAETGAIPIESRAGVYRKPDRNHEIAVETESNVSSLGIADATVSRKKNGDAPVVFKAHSESIEVRNQNNSNGVVVRTKGDTQEIEQGFSARIRRDAVVELGYQTELQLTVERERKVEVQNGDYVAGSKTEVQDSVVNRSDISGGGVQAEGQGDQSGSKVKDSVVNRSNVDEGGRVDDSVVNRSNVGGSADNGSSTGSRTAGNAPADDGRKDLTTTRNRCETHDITYTGETCPECAKEGEETKFCLYCGEEIPNIAAVCPACGEQLPET